MSVSPCVTNQILLFLFSWAGKKIKNLIYKIATQALDFSTYLIRFVFLYIDSCQIKPDINMRIAMSPVDLYALPAITIKLFIFKIKKFGNALYFLL